MSNQESFIDEVTEEVRRDRLYGLFRRWGWVPALAVVAIVGGTAWNEWQKSQESQRAQGFGDAVLSALSASDMEARRAALADVPTSGEDQSTIKTLLTTTAVQSGDAGDTTAARDALLALADRPGQDAVYRHLALIKVMGLGGTGDVARDGAILDELAAPGAPFRGLALEQQALAAIRADDVATAVTLLRVLSEDAETTQSLRSRAAQLMVALGVSPDPA
ncbi:hypothetical protein JANAI62_29440 [Jannaschia pagri]|uniref:Ancillary SecYEG translocon subunit/Cell division coordinator CpoB TPR domain-containing protein n=1 Tax=Jannaschia pagri TaxID=2829797 RepID=A0ABQ4NPI1_9RHOB|nr:MULTISPECIES: tetratricopeptide repeat protein [unclassified Jannaschia]GIT92486.1 hypothetical protein JANAI61_29440 [Jannaschia sp. AI_61]GIT96321.1 hypothetical protein JANAI62_29440 [Jannaschia sp. AI_62]